MDFGDAFRTRFPVLTAALGGGADDGAFLTSFLTTGAILGLVLCLLCTEGVAFCGDLTGEGPVVELAETFDVG